MTKPVAYGVYFFETTGLTRRAEDGTWGLDEALRDAKWMAYILARWPYREMSRDEALAELKIRRPHHGVETVPHVEETSWSSYLIFDVRPLDWTEREKLRFNRGDYKPLPWRYEPWFHNSEHSRTHFAHISTEDPTKIAFTASPEHGKADRQTRMKPGKYLQKYFGDVLTPKQVEYLATWFRTGQQPPRDYDGEFALATTPDDIVDVYAADISSCMEGADAVQVYGAGDLAVAHWDYDGEPVARALCWPEKQVFGRIYPDPEGGTTDSDWGTALEQAMRAKGWKHVNESSEGFNGAKLLKIPSEGTYMMPYIDLSYGVDDKGDHFVMTSRNADHWPDRTDGLLTDPGVPCDRCGATEDEDDLYTVHTYTHQSGDYVYAGGAESWCSRCEENHAYRCEGTGEMMDDAVTSAVHDGDTVTLAWAENEVAQGRAFQNPEDSSEFSSEPYETDEEAEADTETLAA